MKAEQKIIQLENLILKIIAEKDGDTLQYASKDLRDNKEVVMEAVKQNGYALESASERLQKLWAKN